MSKTPLHTTPDNKALIAREQAIERAIDIYGFILLSYVRRQTRDYHLAEDILQELWCKVHEDFKIEQFMHLPLLKRKARQLVIDEFRRRGVRSFIEYVEEIPETDGRHVFLESASKEQEEDLWNAFWRNFDGINISDDIKDAFWLKERHGYSINQISEHLHVPHSTVHDWIVKLRRECEKYRNKESI